MDKVIAEFPNWANSKITLMLKGKGYYIFKVGNETYVTTEYDGTQFTIHRPTVPTIKSDTIRYNANDGVTGASNDPKFMVGGFETVRNFSEPIFASVLAKIKQKIPETASATVTKALSQVV